MSFRFGAESKSRQSHGAQLTADGSIEETFPAASRGAETQKQTATIHFTKPSTENEALTSVSALFFGDLRDAEFFLHVLKRDALGSGYQMRTTKNCKAIMADEEDERVTAGFCGHRRKSQRDDSGHEPVRKAAEALA